LIEGEFEGRLEVQAPVAIGAGGVVRGDIVAQSVRVGGELHGNVTADERFELEPEGRIEGDVTAPRVVIAEGAYFKGNVEMKGSQGSQGSQGGRPGG
jgi:cytoskeletal protein CcmA (bactofilin family)